MLLKAFLVALWLSFLFLPFKGFRAATLFFCVILISLLFWMMFLRFRGTIVGILPVFYSPEWFSQKQMHSIVLLSFVSAMAIPFFAGDYFLDIAILAGIYIILALGLNIVVGFAGLLNLGFAAFYAIGAYTYALLNTRLGLGF
jgi:branched-chain amino acid transport system permease protein